MGCSALIFQTIFSGSPKYAWTAHVAAPIIGGSFSGMMGLGIWFNFPRQNVFVDGMILVRAERNDNPFERNQLWQ